MKTNNLYLSFLICLLIATRITNAQWVQTNGPNGGYVSCFAVSGTNLFAGTLGDGVFLSTNNGTSWTAVNTGLTNIWIQALAISGTNLFAGAQDGIFRSTNNGTNWTEVITGLTGTYVTALAVRGMNLFAGTFDGGVFLSTNNGTNWSAVNTGLTNTHVFALAVNGINLFAGAGTSVFLSTNNGTSWNATGFTNTGNVRAFAVSDTYLFAGAYNGVFLSTNNGTSWNAINTGLTNTNISALTILGMNLFAGTLDGGVFLTTNNGANWSAVNAGLTNNHIGTLVVSGTYLFAGTSGSGVWRRPLEEMIPTNIILYPKISLSAGSINAGQSITISGTDFQPNGTANINIYGNNGFSQIINNISTDAQGSLTYSYATTTSMLAGIYNVQVTDNTTGLTAPTKSFTLNVASGQTIYLNITWPTQTFTVEANESFMIEWKDKMVTGSNYMVIGSQRIYKYTIELSDDNGFTWETLGTVEGQEYIGNWVMLHYYTAIATPGSSYKIRITDFYNTNNTQSTPTFTVSSGTYTGNLKVQLDWDHSYPQPSAPIAGIAADGTARLFLNLSKINGNTGPNISSVSVTLSDNNVNGIDASKLGRVKVATQTTSYSLEANGIQTITDEDNTPNKSNYIFWYVAPDDFAGADPEDIDNSYRFVTATFTVNYENSLIETFTKKIQIVRPPVALVHGLASDPSTWDDFTFTSPNGLPVQYLSSYNYLFHEVFPIRISPSAHFIDNAFGLVVPSSTQPLYNTLQGVIKKMRTQGYAANQVDYIAHSMGGNVIRQTINLFPNAFNVTGNFANSPYKNYEMGFVHKIITLNTPHNGSPLGDLVTQTTPYLEWIVRHLLSDMYNLFTSELSSFIHPIGDYNYVTLSYDEFEASDAIKDLEVNDPGVNMGETNMPSHLIAGDVFGNSSIIDPYVWNTTDQIPFFTGFINAYWQALRALETDPAKKAQLNIFASINSNAERAVKFLDYYVSAYLGTPNFILDGDFIVHLSSQVANLNTTNVSVYSGFYANHLNITGDLEVGDRAFQLINSPIDGPLFGDIPASTNTILSKNYSIQTLGTIISEIDTNKIKILYPLNFSNYTSDSVLIIKTQIKDTANLKYVELNFQGESYLTTSINSFINFNIQVKSEFLENQQIVATAVYDVSDTTKFLSDTVNVSVSVNQPVQGFTASPEIQFLKKNQTAYPDYYATYTSFVTKVGNNNSNLTVTINDPNIVSRDSLSIGFTGKNDGETFAIIEYGGLKDTIYFSINGDNITGVFEGDDNSGNSIMPDKYDLFQNYPNPFNPTTTIKYSIPSESLVKIKIYDILGREVTVLVNEEKSAGNYTIQFNGNNFASGVYLYRIQAGNFVDTKKMILMK